MVIAVLKWDATSRRNRSHSRELCSNATIASTVVGRLNARPPDRGSGLRDVASVIASTQAPSQSTPVTVTRCCFPVACDHAVHVNGTG
ncbi:MAG: hypothetical protein DMF84_22050 [Acidobacteria bacterium]|nr:MAG: hypothetical protein DMF84_22050 [Acidobacteriota bacterium]